MELREEFEGMGDKSREREEERLLVLITSDVSFGEVETDRELVLSMPLSALLRQECFYDVAFLLSTSL